MKIVLEEFRPVERNTLRGFARLTVPELGMVLHDVAVHARDGRAWASPPGRPMVGRDGVQMRDAAGKPQFAPTLGFTSRADQDGFSAAVVAVVRARHPEAVR